MERLIQFAATESATENATGDVFSALGIDWRLLILQILAFLVLVWLLGKYVYPWLMKSVDERQKNIEEAAKAAKKAQESASESEAETARLLTQARKDAAEIIATAKLEATELISTSEAKAKASAEQIVANAKAQTEKDIDKARRQLHDETIELIAYATEKIIHQKMDTKADEALIVDVLKGIK